VYRPKTCIVWLAAIVSCAAPICGQAPSPPESDAAPKTAGQNSSSQPAADADKPKFTVTPYGRVELDLIYSSRGTNPLDPRQFNGYSTAAGPENTSSATFNPRFTVLGLNGGVTKGAQEVDAKIEVDFYSTDSANLLTPRLRLAFIEYKRKDTRVTFGMDWLPVAALLPDINDFSIMGYGGNLWQRLPQVTVRQKLSEHWEVLGTAFRAERGFTLQPAPYTADPFTDPVKMPFIGARAAYQNWGAAKGGLLAVSGAYRQFKFPATGRSVKSDLLGLELVVPVADKFKWETKLTHGQGLGDEFFRFGQGFNQDRPIRTTAWWSEALYTPNRRSSVAAGYGSDDPNNADLAGISNNNGNYTHNQRVFGNFTVALLESFKFSFEVNYLRTNWTNGDRFSGVQPMVSFFFTF
jgi:hypothetical protein